MVKSLPKKLSRAGVSVVHSNREGIFGSIFNNISDGVLLAEIATKKLYLGNNKICKMLGYSHKALETLQVSDIHPKKDLPFVLEQFKKQVQGKITLSKNIPMKRKDGSVFYADINSSNIQLEGKDYLVGIFRKKNADLKTYKKLIEEKARDDAVLQSIGDGLIVVVDVDKGGKIAYVNKVFEEMTGWKLDEIFNKKLIAILPREDKDGKKVSFKNRILTKVLAGEKVIADLSQPFYYIRKDKSKFPVASIITPIVLGEKIVGAVETFRDISKESEADKAKTEFASLVSHQLRTPFATINWYIELLLDGDVGSLNEKQSQYLQEVYKASKRMVNLINVLLSVSRIQMGKTEIEEKLVDVNSLIKAIINEEEPNIKNKNLHLKAVCDKNIPNVPSDPKQLTIVFQNLLSNAIKYSRNGGKITLKLGIAGTNLVFSIADTGIGIPKTAQPKIFSRFFRAENAKAQEPEGIGLGLYILKAVIDGMKGKIWFESQENKGSTFYVTIPIKRGNTKV